MFILFILIAVARRRIAYGRPYSWMSHIPTIPVYVTRSLLSLPLYFYCSPVLQHLYNSIVLTDREIETSTRNYFTLILF